MRTSGTTASLAGLEKAAKLEDIAYRDTAIRRIIMIHSIILSVGGIPLIYLGDEVGTPNDYSYRNDPGKADDSRWVHRPYANQEKYERRHDEATAEGQIFTALLRLITLRKQTPVFADGETYFIYAGNPHILAYTRHNSLLVLANFAEFLQSVDVHTLANEWPAI
ncbi:MAG: amylosucrase, partial [Chloroflexota bacterium]